MRIQLDHPYTAAEIGRILSVLTRATGNVTHLTTDSREVKPGDLFIALRGERQNGNHYIKEALARGARMAIAEELWEREDVIAVEDSTIAIQKLAAAARTRLSPTVIAITGSVGKTTTKDMIAAVLSRKYRTHKTEGNENNHLGLSFTLLSMPANTELAVVELGMNHAREIAALSCIARPDLCVITNVGTAHIGNLGSRSAIARAKMEILEGCEPATPYLYPADEPLLAPPCHATTVPLAVGDREGFDAAYLHVREEKGHTVADFLCGRRLYRDVRLAGRGRHLAAAAAYAVFLGDLFGVPEEDIRAALQETVTAGRQEINESGGVTWINDSYNASPESVEAALDLLSMTGSGRHIAVLGDMLELGRETRTLHERVGRRVAESGVDLLFTFGAAAEEIAGGAITAGMPVRSIIRTPDPTAHALLAARLSSLLKEGDTVLLKASRGMAAERIFEAIVRKNGEERECV